MARKTMRDSGFTEQEARIIENVNNAVNDYPYIKDRPSEHWATREEFITGEKGRDCEDFALEKARRLIDVGFSDKRFNIWIVELWPDYYHAVLVIDEKLVLDNRYSYVYLLTQGKWEQLMRIAQFNL
ncbi:MAG: transglutaminase-like cysteine peptidase, partial [Candidatus Liptonbacteria bacterium]|nr:transglutaminase-like cysteine peptidase [Candidatus Liptonbacteria bacterium]